MPEERQQPQKRRRLPFNPPRPRASPSAGPSTSKPATGKASKKSDISTGASSTKKPNRKSTAKPRQRSPGDSPSDAESFSASRSPSPTSDRDGQDREQEDEPDYILAEITTNAHTTTENDVLSSQPAIPPKLLTTLLHHHFQNGKTKMAKDANAVVAKYVDVFVREALARAAYERGEGAGAGGTADAVGDGWLEVEDLEKMAPQLVLDF